MDKIPIILLAAGNSSRMQRPKQLLPWGAGTLIEHQINVLKATTQPLYVVLGASAGQIIPLFEKTEVEIVLNNLWEKGMGSSVSAGIKRVEREVPGAKGVLFALIDQPLVTTDHFKNLISKFQAEKRQIIVSQSVSGWRGAPALFDKVYFNELMCLDGTQGAKTIINKYPDRVIGCECADILEDMDTPENYRQLLKRYKVND
ncbi:nucleotidyltransferase family protein [Prolixibacteraceae bacterium Z1-6]|uniref:Nucleotidyltransferase family protein n=1 Tax=Draconibacterium aestuarii TaxID=2998507 RepID=A0A9X3F6Y1_9BACT|nr:nucleotidyltransferase family protein [Prolixibacteraceae bacterium Z1-6]